MRRAWRFFQPRRPEEASREAPRDSGSVYTKTNKIGACFKVLFSKLNHAANARPASSSCALAHAIPQNQRNRTETGTPNQANIETHSQEVGKMQYLGELQESHRSKSQILQSCSDLGGNLQSPSGTPSPTSSEGLFFFSVRGAL